MGFEILLGVPYPLDSTPDAGGVNFSVFSRVATHVEVRLYDPANPEKELGRFDLQETTDCVRHGYLKGLQADALFGFSVHPPYAPEQGHRCKPAKLLAEPYAKASRCTTSSAIRKNTTRRTRRTSATARTTTRPGVVSWKARRTRRKSIPFTRASGETCSQRCSSPRGFQ